ncbi:MFS transporter [Burkholderia sp. GS2Y]|uniref:MFS transporter n=1 Tax=Burkholderia theae TaxID=3143496 RepID=A0ABU9WVJ3_9BURK
MQNLPDTRRSTVTSSRARSNVDIAEAASQAVVKKVTWHLIPFLLVLYIVAFIDRVNISFAALSMSKSLGMGPEAYGLAAGIFFIGYFAFEVPGNVMLKRFGARIWITRILISWGVVVFLTAFVQNTTQLYLLRFVLGLAEAGFFPGIILYLTMWFPRNQLAKTVAMFMTAIPIAFIIGGPVSTWLIDNMRGAGLEGWRWMFLIEGLAAVLLGPITLFYLTDEPAKAQWLSSTEKETLIQELSRGAQVEEVPSGAAAAFRSGYVWYLALTYFLYIAGTLGLVYFIPQITKQLSSTLTNFQVGLVTAIPYVAGAIAMNLWGHHSDKTSERTWHAVLPLVMIVATYMCMASGLFNQISTLVMALTVAVIGTFCFSGPFWAIPPKFLTGSTAAVGIAIINSCGGLGGFAGPYLMGYLKNVTHGTGAGLLVLCCSLTACALMLLGIRKMSNDPN